MQATYDEIVDFMKRYFEAFNTVAQDPETIHQMHEYFAPELEVRTYFPWLRTSNREKFLRFVSSHPSIKETLTTQHIVVDDRQKIATALLSGQATVTATGETIVSEMSAHYQLILDENNTIKIRKLWIFVEGTKPGETNIAQLYGWVK